MSTDLPLYEPDADATYQLEIVAQLTGLSSETILLYQESGLIETVGESGFDDEAILAIRRIEHLRCTSGADFPALKLILNLMKQVERLQAQLRARR